jgi:hypothetical protein
MGCPLKVLAYRESFLITSSPIDNKSIANYEYEQPRSRQSMRKKKQPLRPRRRKTNPPQLRNLLKAPTCGCGF